MFLAGEARQKHPTPRTFEKIPMYQGEVVDHDEDSGGLWQRVRKRYGKEPVLITPVLQEARQTIVVRSPRLLENIR